MNRSELGPFGAGMSDGELAQALAAYASVSAGRPDLVTLADVERQLLSASVDGIVEAGNRAWRYNVARYAAVAPVFAQAWQRMLAEHPEGVRIEVPRGYAEENTWLGALLLHPAVQARSLYHRQDEPEWPVAWEWPLRLGTLGSARTSRHRELEGALAALHHPKLWTRVDMQQPGSECELLLLPGDLRQALGDLLDAPQRPRADCVLVLGAHPLAPERIHDLAAAVRREARTSGVACLPAGSQLDQLLSAIVRELSHDRTLDVALFEAVRQAPSNRRAPRLPELVFSRSLAIFSSVRLTAARMARDVSPEPVRIPLGAKGMPAGAAIAPARAAAPGAVPTLEAASAPDAGLADASRALQDLVRHGQWSAESTDATRVVEIRRQMEDSMGHAHRTARVTSRAMPPQAVAEPDERQVLTQIFERTDETTRPDRERVGPPEASTPDGPDRPTRTLRPDAAYLLRVRIGIPDADSVAAGIPFPAHELPASESGHTIAVSFVPLTAGAGGVRAAAQQGTVFLPATGGSRACEFPFSTRGVRGAYRARLILSHENRVLQTLTLEAALFGATPQPYTLAVENLVQAGFHNLAYQRGFDGALVVNHSPEGEPGFTALVGSKVTFAQPAEMGQAIQMLQDTLTDHTALQAVQDDLGSDAVGKLIYGLMQHGRLLYDQVEEVIGALDHDAGRIQMVEARVGAAFPVEFLYPLEVPPTRPPMCPNARSALLGEPGGSHQDCPHRDDPDHMCPVRFWGFRKQVERQPAAVVASDTPGDVTTLAVPSPLNGKLDLLRSVQVGRSAKVLAADYDLPAGLLKVLQDHCVAVHTPGSWSQWKGSVQEQSPGLLLLLSHTDRDEDSNLPALEISAQKLPVGSIEASYIKGPAASAPVVFLLGCDTADPKLGFINFVARFKKKQAALVVGTLSTISARRAAGFLAVALPLLKQAENSGRTFGEVFLQIKRAALAGGDGFALSLVAYGDSGWQL